MNKKVLKREEINFHGNNITLLKKRVKNINLTIRTDGRISLSVPFKISEKEIYNFLESRKDWIHKTKSKFKEIQIVEKEYISGETIEYLGLQYILNIIEIGNLRKIDTDIKTNQKKVNSIEISGEYLDIYVLEKDNNKEYIENLLINWYRKNLEYIVIDLTEIWAENLGLRVNEIRVRKLKRTWGSCNTKKHIITYSIELAKKKRELIEYVVVHELAHLVHDNHGKEFKDLLTKLMPDWKTRKKELNNLRI